MNEKTVLRILQRTGAILRDDHFVYTSGRHGRDYINKDALYPHSAETRRLSRELAEHCAGYGAQVVAGPALGGIILSQWVAYHLSKITRREILGVYSEKDERGEQTFQRGYAGLVRGKNILLVEDVLTTGQSVMQLAARVREEQGRVVAIGALVNRDPWQITPAALGAPLVALACADFPSWPAEDCPLCAAGVPINSSVGKGADFLARATADNMRTDR